MVEMVIPFRFNGKLYPIGSVIVVYHGNGREAYTPEEWAKFKG